MKLLLFPFPSFVVVAGLLLSVPSSTASTVSLAGSSKDRVHHDGGDDGLGTATRRHRQLLPLSVPGLIHLYTGDSSNANDSVGTADGEVGANTKFVAGRKGLSFDFDGTFAAPVRLPVNINSSVLPKLTSK